MLRGAAEVLGWSIRAEEGEVGHLSDVYFDDRRWAVRYLACCYHPGPSRGWILHARSC